MGWRAVRKGVDSRVQRKCRSDQGLSRINWIVCLVTEGRCLGHLTGPNLVCGGVRQMCGE